MSRMPGVADREASWTARFIFQPIRRRAGRLSETWRIAAHKPGLLLGWTIHEVALDRVRTVDRRLRVLAQIKVAVLIGCPG